MDDLKKNHVRTAPKYDFNVQTVAKLRDRRKIHKMLNRYARRILKEDFKNKKEYFVSFDIEE